jgi:hypothetical protein
MRTIHRTVVIAAAVAAAGVAGASVMYHAANQDPHVVVAAGNLGVSTQEAASIELRSALESSEKLNDGAHVGVDVSLPQALEAGMIGGSPDGVVLEPAHCMSYLSNLLGDRAAEASGWVQMGVRPEQKGQYSAMVASVPGGVSPEGILAGIEGCESGIIALEHLGVKGTFSITAVDAPDVRGAESVLLRATTTFPSDVSDEELAEALSCSASVETVVTEASQACSEPREVSAHEVEVAQKMLSFYSNDYYFAYVMAGDLMAESCEVEQFAAIEIAVELFEHASSSTT